MSAICEQDELTDSAKDDGNNLVTVLSTDNGGGNNFGMEVDNNQSPNNHTVTAEIIENPLTPNESHNQTASGQAEQTATASMNLANIDPVLENKNIDQIEIATDKQSSIEGLQMSSNSLVEDIQSSSIDSPLTTSLTMQAEPIGEIDTGYKETTIDDVSEPDFELKWSDAEDDEEAVTPLGDEALKKLDEELGIGEKLEKFSKKQENSDDVSNIEEPREIDRAKEMCDTQVTDMKLINETDKLADLTILQKPATLSVASSSADKLKNNLVAEIVEYESDKVVKKLPDLVSQNDKEQITQDEEINQTVTKDNVEHSNVDKSENKAIESMDISDAVASGSDLSVHTKEDNVRPLDAEIPCIENEIKSQTIPSAEFSLLAEESSENVLKESELLSEKTSALCDKIVTDVQPEEIIPHTESMSGIVIENISSEILLENSLKAKVSDLKKISEDGNSVKELSDKPDKTGDTDSNITLETTSIQEDKEKNTEIDSDVGEVSINADVKKCEDITTEKRNISLAAEKNDLPKDFDQSLTANVTSDSIKINTEHRINRPDVMLDIPTQEFDIDDFYDSSECQEFTDKPEKEDTDLTTKTVTEIVNQRSKVLKDDIIKKSEPQLKDKTLNETGISVSDNQAEIPLLDDVEMKPAENVSYTTEKIGEDTNIANANNTTTSNVVAEISKKSGPGSTTEKQETPANVSIKISQHIEMSETVSPVRSADKETKQEHNVDLEKITSNVEKSGMDVPKSEKKCADEKVQTKENKEKFYDVPVIENLITKCTDQTEMLTKKEAEIDKESSEKEVTDAQPSTSKTDHPSGENEKTNDEPGKSTADAEEPQEVTDSLGLLAESSRVMDEEEEEEDEPEPEEEEVDEGDDEDADFDPDCEESSNQTGDHSEESNTPHSEIDIQEEGIDIEFNNEADKIQLDGADSTFDALLGDSTDVPDIETIAAAQSIEIKEDDKDKPVEIEQQCTESPPESDTSKKVENRRGSLLADLLTKPRANMNLPEGSVKVDARNKQAIDSAIVDLEAISSDDDSQAKIDMRQQMALIMIANQIEDAVKSISTKETDSAETETEKQKDNKPKTSEIFNLDSDDDDKQDKKEVSFIEKPKEGNQCINYDCTSDDSVPYYLADRMTIAFYGAARRRRRPVCQHCLNVVNSRNEGLVSGIKDLRPLMSLRMSRPAHTLLEISDSDSEGEDEPVGEEGAKFLEDELTNMLNDVWSKYNMDDRLKDTEVYLEAELEKMQKASEEVDRMLRECQAATDRVRTELYASFEGPRTELPAINIHDTPIASYSCMESEEDNGTEVQYPKRRASATEEAPAKRPAHEDKRTTRSMHDGHKPDDDKDVSVVRLSAELAPPDLPPLGEPNKPPLRVGIQVYAMKNQYGAWLKGKVLDIQPKTNEHQYTLCKVRFEHKVKNPCKQLSARSIAYTEPCNVRMTIGTRVIALFKNSENTNKRGEFYYSGVIAEVPNPVNKYRYLVFFDDGYAQYVEHKHTRLVYESKTLVWEEVHPFSRDFVCNYLMKYPERPMVRMHAGQAVTVEWNGTWWKTTVMEVDAALVHVRFPDNRTEWIYRGSTRLQPLFAELQAARRGDRARLPRSTKASIKTNVPYVEYIRTDDQAKPESSAEDLRRQRSVAKKSTSIAQQITSAATDGVISRVVFYTPKNSVRPLKMVPHNCSPQCKRKDLLTLADLQTYNPLTKPLLSGWERQIVHHKSSRAVMYRTPCGRRVRNLAELHRYLRAVRSDMAVDLFDFNPNTHCLAEFVLSKTNVQKKDLSHGKENIPVPCVNYYDHSLPEFCSYNTERTPTAGVPLNLDPDFLCGCDCVDDCMDKTKCACWKMTLEGARTIGIEGTDVGYHYRRLPEPLPSGIYECNSRCKCKATCLNRVVQNPLQLKLQVFKTLNRGWGIRALNDVPKGAFICIYAGNLLTDATANLDGLNEGDEYLAELDYIEVVEAMKEGYEEDVPDPDKVQDQKELKKSESEPESESTESEEEEVQLDKNDIEDGDFQPGYRDKQLGILEFNKRLRRREKKKVKEEQQTQDSQEKVAKKDDDCITISDDEEVSKREPSRFAAEETMTDNKVTSKYRSIRSYFGKDEACYIMDAKVQGNIGRYLNHSCSPNVFVQNVFVDTHDPRFPWVSFFALHHIRAGTELTWNYNYDIGSVPGKVLYCYCGATNCRGRLL